MPFVPTPNVMEMEFRYVINAQKCENRIMVNNLGPVAFTDLQDLAVLGWNWWENVYSDNVGQNVLLSEVVVTDLTVQNGEQYSYAPDTTTTGVKDAPLPNEVAFCISLRSNARGRSARGRWFAVSLSGNDRVDPNTLTTAYVGDLVLAMNNLRQLIDTAGKSWVIVSYRNNNAPRPGGPVFFAITGCVATDNIVDSQRRRKPGVGA